MISTRPDFFLSLLVRYLTDAGFGYVERVSEFGLFEDASGCRVRNRLIGLNLRAVKAPA